MPLTRDDVLEMIANDMEADAVAFEGKPFNGRTVGELHGNLCATIRALTKIVKDQNAEITKLKTHHHEQKFKVTEGHFGADPRLTGEPLND